MGRVLAGQALMPLYQYDCALCGHSQDEFRHIEQRDDAPTHCGAPMARVITPHRVIADIQPYRSMVDGSVITSRRRHRNHLKRHGVVEVGNEKPAPRKPVPLDREKRKRAIAEVVNCKL